MFDRPPSKLYHRRGIRSDHPGMSNVRNLGRQYPVMDDNATHATKLRKTLRPAANNAISVLDQAQMTPAPPSKSHAEHAEPSSVPCRLNLKHRTRSSKSLPNTAQLLPPVARRRHCGMSMQLSITKTRPTGRRAARSHTYTLLLHESGMSRHTSPIKRGSPRRWSGDARIVHFLDVLYAR